MTRIVIIILLSFISFRGNAQEINCAKFKDGCFVYPEIPEGVTVRKGAKQWSYLDDKLEAVWKVNWIDECTYTLTCKKIKKGSFNFKKGDRIYVEIVGTEGDCMDVNVSLLLGGKRKSAVQTGRMCFESDSEFKSYNSGKGFN